MNTSSPAANSARSLRILQINSLFSGGGVDNQTLELTRALHDLGHHVGMAVAANSRWEERARHIGCPVTTFPSKSALRWRLIAHLVSVLRRRRVEILHIHQGRDYWPGIIAARLAGQGTRVVITRHLMTRPRGFSRSNLLKFADIVAVSHAVERVLREELQGNQKRIHQIHCGIDIARFHPGRTPAGSAIREELGCAPSDVLFGVVGMYERPRGKGQFEFLEAAHRIAQQHPNARFVLVGKGGLQAELESMIQTSGLTGRASMVGFREDMPALMSALDVLVHPTTGTEAFPLVVLEAFASGKPVIASDLDGIPEQVVPEVHGLLVPRADVPALANAMSRLAGNPELRARMGEAGRGHVETRFTREILGSRFEELYLNLVGGTAS